MEKRSKITRKETLNSIIFLDLIFLFLELIILAPLWPWSSNIDNPKLIAVTIVSLIFIIVLNSFLWFPYMNSIKLEKNSNAIDNYFSKDIKEVEVIPLRKEIRTIKVLNDYSKFYASKDGDFVKIYVKLPGNKILFFESITKEYFFSSYKFK